MARSTWVFVFTAAYSACASVDDLDTNSSDVSFAEGKYGSSSGSSGGVGSSSGSGVESPTGSDFGSGEDTDTDTDDGTGDGTGEPCNLCACSHTMVGPTYTEANGELTCHFDTQDSFQVLGTTDCSELEDYYNESNEDWNAAHPDRPIHYSCSEQEVYPDGCPAETYECTAFQTCETTTTPPGTTTTSTENGPMNLVITNLPCDEREESRSSFEICEGSGSGTGEGSGSGGPPAAEPYTVETHCQTNWSPYG
jgi:hypothetical protein